MNKRFRRRIAGSALVLASMGMVSTALVVGGSSAGAATANTAANTTGITCSDPLCVVVETIVFDLGTLLNTL